MTEKEFQAQVIEVAELYGWKPGHFTDSRKQAGGRLVGDKLAAGIPDLILVRERAIWAELKTDKGRLRSEQVVWLDGLAKAGSEVYEWRPDDLQEIQKVLSRRWRYLPRGDRATTIGRADERPCLVESDELKVRLWTPGSLWVGDGRADVAKLAA